MLRVRKFPAALSFYIFVLIIIAILAEKSEFCKIGII
jgi:hypothetical protein